MVDPDHGATLRTSWSIDESEGLGKVEFGVSLEYNAVSRACIRYSRNADVACFILRYLHLRVYGGPKAGFFVLRRTYLNSDDACVSLST